MLRGGRAARGRGKGRETWGFLGETLVILKESLLSFKAEEYIQRQVIPSAENGMMRTYQSRGQRTSESTKISSLKLVDE